MSPRMEQEESDVSQSGNPSPSDMIQTCAILSENLRSVSQKLGERRNKAIREF